MVRILQNTFKILWLYILCGALVSIVWFVNWRAYFPVTSMEMMQIEGVIYAVIVGNILYFSYKGIAEPQSFLQKSLLSLVAIITLSLSGLLAYKGWLQLEKQRVLFSLKYLKWLGEILMIFSLPAFVSVLATFVALKNSLFSLGAQKLVEDEPYGSARLCSAQEAISQNDKNGLPIGRILSSVQGDDINLIKRIMSSKTGDIFKYNPVHSFLIAPTGVGKGIGFVIPTLLEYDGPVIAIDPKKAENFTVTHRYRKKGGSRKIHAFDTSDLTGQKTAKINIFDFLDPNDSKFIDDIKMFISSLCPCTGDERTDYFKEAAQDILTCVALAVSELPKEERNLISLYDLIMQRDEDLEQFFIDISENEENSSKSAIRLANKVLSTEKRELSGCMNTARKALRFLDSDSYRNIVSKTNFEINDIFENKADLFFCIPSLEIKSHGHSFIRLVISLLVKKIKELERRPGKNILFLLDEMAGIGRVDAVEDILLEGRGYGIKFIGIAQTISALKKLYREEIDTMLSSSLVMFLGVRIPDDLSYISKQLGYKTVFTESDSINDRKAKAQEGHTKSAVKREILTTSEISELGKKYVVAFIEDSKPLILERLNYLKDKAFKGKFDENKFHQKA